MTTINRKQPMRPAEIDLLNQVDTNTADIATQTERLTQEIADRTNGDNVLQQAIQDQLTFLQSVPAQEFGMSKSIDVQANSSSSVDINFGSAMTKAPIVLCGLQHASGNLSCIVNDVTNQKFSVTVYNHSSTNVSGVTIYWLAISGR